MNGFRISRWYMLSDFLASYVAWMLFFIIRKIYIEVQPLKFTYREYLLCAGISLCWVIAYWLVGLYKSPYRRSRLRDMAWLFQTTVAGVLFIFFITLLDDQVQHFSDFRFMVVYYLGIQFGIVGCIRFIISTVYKRRISSGKMGFSTLMIGCGSQAFNLWNDLNSMRYKLGYDIKGFISIPETKENLFFGKLKHFGGLERMQEVIKARRITEIIIAIESDNRELFLEIIRACRDAKVRINVIPDMYDFLVGNVKISNVLGAPLIEIYPHIIAPWEAVIKRMIDISAAIFVLVLGSPFYAVVSLLIKLDSKGPVFYRQERIGKNGKPFNIYKFRSMRVDAEKFGPALASDHDPRITRIGRFLRKMRLDEFPQFYNVLVGDMSLVGPRPERKYFIDQIVKDAPEYLHLLKVRPGITSWGQVKYGYAENVEQMKERLKFDLLYIENLSLGLDLKIIAYTVIIVLEGRGK